MSLSVKVFAWCAAVLAGSCHATDCRAQLSLLKRSNSSAAKTPAPKTPAVKTRSYTDSNGIITSIAAESISVVVDRKLWVLVPKPDCIVEVSGEANASYLKAGMIVRIYGQFDKRLRPLRPVEFLEVVSPESANAEHGIFPDTLPPDEEAARAKQAAEQAKAAVPPAAANAVKADGMANAKGPAVPQPVVKDDDDAGTATMIAGQINLIKEGELVVGVGNRTVRVKLAEKAKIMVSLTDFTLAKKGDVMKKFSCDYYQPGRGAAKLMLIEMANPLTGSNKTVKKTAATPPTGGALRVEKK